MSKKHRISPCLLALAMTAVVALTFASEPRPGRAQPIEVAPAAQPFEVSALTVQSFTYSGKHSDWVRKLLTRVDGWKCPSNASDGGAPPSVRADECMRDKYVAAAVVYAWAAECYARNEEDSKAAEAAEGMYKQLEAAQGLCSDAPSVGGGGACDTEKIFRCGEL